MSPGKGKNRILDAISFFIVLVVLASALGTSVPLDDSIRTLSIFSEGQRVLAHRRVGPSAVVAADRPKETMATAWKDLLESPADGCETEIIDLARDVNLARWGDPAAILRVKTAASRRVAKLPYETRTWAERVRELPSDGGERRVSRDGGSEPFRVVNIAFLWIRFLLAGSGVLLLFSWVRNGVPSFDKRRVAVADVGSAFTALIRGLAIGFASLVCVTIMRIPYVPYTLILFFPVFLMIEFYLLRPQRLGAAEAFGLRFDRGSVPNLLLTSVGLAGLLEVAEFGAFLTARVVGVKELWTDQVVESLMWGTWQVAAVDIVDAIALAPAFEEIVFRGVVFTSIRRRLPAIQAAVLSGAIFGCFHFYSLIGVLAVTSSGIVLALVYEKTRSLVPCIVAHSLSNMLWAGSMLSYRFLSP